MARETVKANRCVLAGLILVLEATYSPLKTWCLGANRVVFEASFVPLSFCNVMYSKRTVPRNSVFAEFSLQEKS